MRITENLQENFPFISVVNHVNKFSTAHDLFKAYPVEELIYEGVKRFEFDDKAFYRAMIIGIK